MKKFERYLGVNVPDEKTIKEIAADFSNSKIFIEQNREELNLIKKI